MANACFQETFQKKEKEKRTPYDLNTRFVFAAFYLILRNT